MDNNAIGIYLASWQCQRGLWWQCVIFSGFVIIGSMLLWCILALQPAYLQKVPRYSEQIAVLRRESVRFPFSSFPGKHRYSSSFIFSQNDLDSDSLGTYIAWIFTLILFLKELYLDLSFTESNDVNNHYLGRQFWYTCFPSWSVKHHKKAFHVGFEWGLWPADCSSTWI